MAHIGRNYRLWFRRDFGLNQFTVNGPGQSYRFVVGQFSSPATPDDVFFDFRGRNDHKESGDHRTWIFDVIGKYGISWAGTFTIDNPPIDGIQTAELLISSDVSLIAFLGRYRATPGSQYEWGAQQFTLFQIEHLSHILTPDPDRSTIDMNVWTWDDGP